MRYKNIPRTNLYSSVIAIGTVPFGTAVDIPMAFQLLDTFFENGGNFIDTAHVYGAWAPNGMGLSEKIIGHWLKVRNRRKDIILGTKGAHPLLSSMHIPRLSPQDIMADIEESLHCLQTETIDLYWLHRDDPKQPVAAILETLNTQVTTGKIRYFGCSNWHLHRIEEAMQYATDHHIAGFVANQLQWSLAVPNLDAIQDTSVVVMDAQIRDFHRKTGLAIVAYTSQAHGFFPKVATNPASLPEQLRKVYENAENADRLRRLHVLSKELSLSLPVLSLAYLTNQALPTFPIFGSVTMSQLLENIKAGDVELSPDEVRYLEMGSLSN